MIQGRRTESPSSINTYKQCARKYYYQYVEKLPTGTSIHLVRGGIVHKVLEDFYAADMDDAAAHSFKFLHLRVLSLLQRYWTQDKVLPTLGLSKEELKAFYDESVFMVQNWFNRFKNRMEARIGQGESFKEAYLNLVPKREEEYLSESYMVKGYIDVVHETDGTVMILDYKTSKDDHITPAYKLQLAIYALLYEEKHGRKPDYVGIDFLKSVERILTVDEDLIKHAKFEIEQIHASTGSNNMHDYRQNPSPLCKWRSGQCDFYDVCFGGMSHETFRKNKTRKT
jgi:ATP-dependent exoDNAse (exonuclease V) beta subunit